MLSHVNVLPMSVPACLADIAPPATRCVPGSRSTKDGVDYVLLLLLVSLIARPRVPSSGRRRPARTCRGNYPPHELPQVAIADQQLDLVSELDAVLCVMAHVLMEVAVLVLISQGTVFPEWWRVSEQSPASHLVEDMLNGCHQRGVLLEPPRWCPRARIGPRVVHDRGLPLILSALVGLIPLRPPSGRPGLFSGREAASPDILVGLGVPPSDPPQLREGGWPVIGERPNETRVLDAFPERLHQGLVGAVFDLHDGPVEALKILL
ncbi:hypothetical protein TIFTF001_050088 [Ficus carica]|uniref:Uncharacterized protein n=1 Tax=Ficus carica TaxID=3494 RepID=A0AA88CLB2_FICCA|nr:hypothetical protein TIFTF001_050088 [Ficus carica]